MVDFLLKSYGAICFAGGLILGLALGIGWHWVAHFVQNLRGR